MLKTILKTATFGAASITAVLAFGATGASASIAEGGAVTCEETGLVRDGIDLTAALINPSAPVVGDVDASGCNIGIYYGPGTAKRTLSDTNVRGANYYGIVANAANLDLNDVHVHHIGENPFGENPFNGAQHGVGVLYTTLDQANEVKYQNGDPYVRTVPGAEATGRIKDSTIEDYQKNGVVVSGPDVSVRVTDNEVAGAGKVHYIAQNGIQVSRGATATVNKNTISDNWYNDSPDEVTACGLLFYKAGGVSSSGNKFRGDEQNLCNFGQRGGGQFSS